VPFAGEKGIPMKKSPRKKQNHTPVPVSVLSKTPKDRARDRHLDELLDEALQETFPASDTPSLVIDDTAKGR
jgi:hypothetical protein